MPINGDTTGQDDIQVRLKTTQEECNRLREENERLRAILGIDHSLPGKPVSQAVSVTKPSSIPASEVYTPEKKITLFRNLFHGREDVFALRWEGKSGKSGYSPSVCRYQCANPEALLPVCPSLEINYHSRYGSGLQSYDAIRYFWHHSGPHICNRTMLPPQSNSLSWRLSIAMCIAVQV
jgi:hypothetical protein